MGTRHLILVYYRGQYHIAQYGQYDGYPSGAGLIILRFVSSPANVAKLKSVLADADRTLYTPTGAQVDAWNFEMAKDAFNPEAVAICPSVNIRTGAKILDIVAEATPEKPVPIVKEMEFLADSLYCEFAYVVDLDADALEVYSDFWIKPMETQGESRFASMECFREVKERLPPMKGRFVFGDLPDEKGFLEALP
ncbi:hypothetical protein SLS54_008222 [Diplodia seriata]